jgi:Helicase conserved C-terminal domain
VAESLLEVPDPLETALDPGPTRPPDQVARALARAAAPPESAVPVPAWLRPDQVIAFRRVSAALERHGIALLADPVGSGKTWIALAVSHALGLATLAVVPATLATQWRRTADRLGVGLAVHSHEALSRGRAPDGNPRLVVVDESHRFRNPATRRYRTLAPWLVRRRLLLLSATPVVNRPADLLHQLHLGLRPGGLALRGIADLCRLLDGGGSHPALGDLILCRPRPAGTPLRSVHRVEVAPAAVDLRALAAVDRLSLSRAPGVAMLLRGTMWRALASSRAALAGVLGRYRALLDQARLARRAGRRVDRAAIRRLTGEAPDQLIMWELFPDADSTVELAPEDLPGVTDLLSLLRSGAADPKSESLTALLGDRRPTLVFTAHRDTLHHLRRELAGSRPAWVSGREAGIGADRGPRDAILELFRPASRTTPAPLALPAVLLATDVAAEGLDLQRADRIVHYDLPWTGVRLEQREGRAVRLGARSAIIDIVRFEPWPALEERLRQGARLAAKRRLVTTAGLDQAGRWLFRWRADLAAWADDPVPFDGFAVVEGAEPGWLFGLALDLAWADGRRRIEPASLVWLPEGGVATEEPERICARLATVLRAPRRREPDPSDATSFRRAIAPTVRARLHQALDRAWTARDIAAPQRLLARRARRLAIQAARDRDPRRLALAERLLAWLSGGLTAGEAMLTAELARSPEPDLLRRWAGLGLEPAPRPIPIPRLAGVIRIDRPR